MKYYVPASTSVMKGIPTNFLQLNLDKQSDIFINSRLAFMLSSLPSTDTTTLARLPVAMEIELGLPPPLGSARGQVRRTARRSMDLASKLRAAASFPFPADPAARWLGLAWPVGLAVDLTELAATSPVCDDPRSRVIVWISRGPWSDVALRSLEARALLIELYEHRSVECSDTHMEY